MQAWLKEKSMGLKKCYRALVSKKPKPISGRIKMYLKKIPSENGGSRMIVSSEDDKEAKNSISEYVLLESISSNLCT
jgi:hypothetical protein